MSTPRPGPSLRVAFAGTPDFAATALAAIYHAGFNVPLVFTQPDRPAGRHLKLSASPVKCFALEHHLKVLQPLSLRRASPSFAPPSPVEGECLAAPTPSSSDTAEYALEELRASACDVMVVAAYGLLLPASVLPIPRYGCINLHASLLPRWRGAAPIQRAIAAGDTQTGITLMQMDAGLDTGPMITRTPLPLHPTDTAGSVHDALAACAAQQIVSTLHQLAQDGALPCTPQPLEGVTYASKITAEEAYLDWQCCAKTLAYKIRAFDPHPGCKAVLEEQGIVLKIVQAYAVPYEDFALFSNTLSPSEALPGTILKISAEGIWVACSTGILCVTMCQKPGGKKLPVREFLAGFSLSIGQRFVLPL